MSLSLYIHQVPRGTKFKLYFDEFTEIEGTFDGNIDHLRFALFCPEISRHVEQFVEREAEVQFIISDHSYACRTRFERVKEIKDAVNESLEFRVITPIKATPLRSNFRITLKLKVQIHSYADDFKKMYSDGWLCDVVSADMSKQGIRVWGDYLIEAPIDTKFTLVFTLQSGSVYMIPSLLKRSQQNYETRSYNYDYGFIFDFSNIPEKQEKLLLEILEYKIKNRA